jgi:hypothetical protein
MTTSLRLAPPIDQAIGIRGDVGQMLVAELVPPTI